MDEDKANKTPQEHEQIAGDLAKGVARQLQAMAIEIHRVYDPQWKYRADVLKTIVSLSSASIVLCVTFSTSIHPLVITLYWRCLIFVSFVLLVAALIIAFVSLWLGKAVYDLQPSFFMKDAETKTAVLESSAKEHFLNAFEQIVDDALEPIAQTDKRADILFGVSCACFCAAIVLLAIVGGRQLLS